MKKSKKKNSKKKKSKKSPFKSNVYMHLEYEITYDPIQNQDVNKLPREIQDQLEDIYYMALEEPEKAIEVIKGLIDKYPNVPELYNYLCSAYSQIDDNVNAEKVALLNYNKNPDYLFAKINYAQVCLLKREFEKIPEIFDNKYDLKLLYPKRNRFHISEYVAFTAVVGEYLANIGKSETSKIYLDMLQKFAPEHKFTKRLERILNPNLMDRILDGIIKYKTNENE